MIRTTVFALGLALSISGTAYGSTWPDSIFNGIDPLVLKEIKAHPDLYNEAKLYLTACVSKDPDEIQGCYSNQRNFVMDYIYAFYDEHMSQQNVAYLLSGELLEPVESPKAAMMNRITQEGIAPNPVQGCAWRLAILGSGGPQVDDTDTLSMQEDCGNLNAADQIAAKARASVLIHEIALHLARRDKPLDIFTSD